MIQKSILFVLFILGINFYTNAQCIDTTKVTKVEKILTQEKIIPETGNLTSEIYMIQLFIKLEKPILLPNNVVAYPISMENKIMWVGFSIKTFSTREKAEKELLIIKETFCDAFLKKVVYGG